MIVSHKYKFIFIKTKKTAGTSIEVFLSQYCGEDDIVTPIHPHVEPHRARNYNGGEISVLKEIKNGRMDLRNLFRKNRFSNHMPASSVKKRISKKVWDNYFKFCVERNPWDKTLSHYHMINDRSGGNLTFDDYLNKGLFCFNYPKYTDSRGQLLVSKVLKYESLMDELAPVFHTLNIPFEGTLGVNTKSEHRKDRTPYQGVYTPEQGKIIGKAFAQEIQMHGYEF